MELVFIRHGFSEWNAKNLFTGWRDVNLTERGVVAFLASTFLTAVFTDLV